MKELRQIIDAYELARKEGKKAALATVVSVEGSSYRGPGARMLISGDGHLTGAISGGCLEGDALRKALMVMMQGTPLLATYDTSDEDNAMIGAALGCKGTIRILIENFSSEQLTLLKSFLNKREAAVLVTFFSPDDKRDPRQGTRVLVRASGEIVHTTGLPADLPAFTEGIRTAFSRKRSFTGKLPFDGENIPFSRGDLPIAGQRPVPGTTQAPLSYLAQYLVPAISLLVAGAGNDVLPLVQMSETLGWDITLVDGRPQYANASRFPDCRLIVAEPENALGDLATDPRTAALLMTHNYHYDKSMLRALLAGPVPYIGMLGPKKKLERMLEELSEEGIDLDAEQRSRIYSPVGLDIGAENAAEIALATLAEINAVFNGKKGGSLRGIPGQIHVDIPADIPGIVW